MFHAEDFRPIPFYFLNDTLEIEEIDRQLSLMKESGVAGFFLHSRCGLTESGYGNRKWFKDIEYTCLKSAELGLTPYLYDEDSYPSGNAGGLIAMTHPEYVAQELKVIKADVKYGRVKIILPACRPLKAYLIGKNNSVSDVTDCFGVIRRRWYGKKMESDFYVGQKSVAMKRSATFNPEIIFELDGVAEDAEVYLAYTVRLYTINRFGSVADNFNKDCVDLFKEYSYNSYYNKMSPEAVSAVKGIFTDEPSASGMLPWTDCLEKTFYELKGYKIEDNYYHLISDGRFGDFSDTVRKDYFQVASGLFRDNYVKNLHEFCIEKKIAFTGHLECEESLYYQALKCLNVYECLWEFDIPGCDLVFDKIGTSANPGLNFGFKIVSSVMRQRGLNKSLCEMFAVNPFNFGADGMRKILNWSFVNDVNLCVPHGFFYGYSGMRKYDAGKSFFFQDPDFKNFNKFASYADNVGRLLSETRAKTDTLLVYPNWEYAAVCGVNDKKAENLERLLMGVIGKLLENHVEFDVTDCNYVDKNFSGGKAKVGERIYKNIITVSAGNPVMRGVIEKLRATEANVITSDQDDWLVRLKSVCRAVNIIPVDGDDKKVLSLYKEKDGEDYIFLYNTASECALFKLSTGGKRFAYRYDGDADKYQTVTTDDGFVTVAVSGYDLGIFVFADSEKQAFGEYRAEKTRKNIPEYEKNPLLNYLPPADVLATVCNYNVKVEFSGKTFNYKNVDFTLLRDFYGADSRLLFDSAMRPVYDKTLPPEKNYPVKAVFTSEFTCADANKILFESETFIGNYEIFLNKVKLDKSTFVSENVYDRKNLTSDVRNIIKNGKNVLEIVFDAAEQNHGINSEIYFIR